MLICQWHLDVVYGKQGEAVKIMRAWGAEKSNTGFRVHSDALAPYIVPGSQEWVIYRVLEESSKDVAARPGPT